MEVLLKDVDLNQFKAWSGAVDTKETIENHDCVEDFNNLINELYPDGIEEGHLNDLLRFEEDWIYRSIGLDLNDDEEE